MSKGREELKALYPFLHGKTKSPESESKALLASIRQKAAESVHAKEEFFCANDEAILQFAQAIANVYRNKGCLLSMGNGGSSCDAAHFAVEFQHPVTTGRPALPAINLSMDATMITAVANDVGVNQIFARQVEALARQNDGLIGFSTSGNSHNLIAAYIKAKELGVTTFGLSGGDGGEMKKSGLVDFCLTVETDSIHRVQEVHVATYHIIWDITHTLLADYRGKLGSST